MIINSMPIIAPKRKDKNKAIIILGQLNIKPIRKTNLTSPKPIPFPLVIKTKNKKKPEANKPAKIG